jgi:hypothetical protein
MEPVGELGLPGPSRSGREKAGPKMQNNGCRLAPESESAGPPGRAACQSAAKKNRVPVPCLPFYTIPQSFAAGHCSSLSKTSTSFCLFGIIAESEKKKMIPSFDSFCGLLSVASGNNVFIDVAMMSWSCRCSQFSA